MKSVSSGMIQSTPALPANQGLTEGGRRAQALLTK